MENRFLKLLKCEQNRDLMKCSVPKPANSKIKQFSQKTIH